MGPFRRKKSQPSPVPCELAPPPQPNPAIAALCRDIEAHPERYKLCGCSIRLISDPKVSISCRHTFGPTFYYCGPLVTNSADQAAIESAFKTFSEYELRNARADMERRISRALQLNHYPWYDAAGQPHRTREEQRAANRKAREERTGQKARKVGGS